MILGSSSHHYLSVGGVFWAGAASRLKVRKPGVAAETARYLSAGSLNLRRAGAPPVPGGTGWQVVGTSLPWIRLAGLHVCVVLAVGVARPGVRFHGNSQHTPIGYMMGLDPGRSASAGNSLSPRASAGP